MPYVAMSFYAYKKLIFMILHRCALYLPDFMPMDSTSVVSPFSSGSQGMSVTSPMSTSSSPMHVTDNYINLTNVGMCIPILNCLVYHNLSIPTYASELRMQYLMLNPYILMLMIIVLFNLLVTLGEAHLSILVQPMDKFRFRYRSEMVGTHGSLLGIFNGRKRNKNNVPTVKVNMNSVSSRN